MKSTIALSLFKSILEASTMIEEEDNNIIDQSEVDPYESSMTLK